ncbi:unnamed protein product, partial [marine sediment metagenome]
MLIKRISKDFFDPVSLMSKIRFIRSPIRIKMLNENTKFINEIPRHIKNI